METRERPTYHVGFDFGASTIYIAVMDYKKSMINFCRGNRRGNSMVNVLTLKKRDVEVGNEGKGDTKNTIYFSKELLGKDRIESDWVNNLGMQYNIFENDRKLAIELVFNNNLSRILSVESIVARILMFCKHDIDEMLGGNPYDVSFNYPCYWGPKELRAFNQAVRAAGFQRATYTYVRDVEAICTDFGRSCLNDSGSNDICFISMGYSYTAAFICRYKRYMEDFPDQSFIRADVKRVAYSRKLSGKLLDQYFLEYMKRVMATKNMSLEYFQSHRNAGYFHKLFVSTKNDLFIKDCTEVTMDLDTKFDLENIEFRQEELMGMIERDGIVAKEMKTLLATFSEFEKTRLQRNIPLRICLCGSSIRALCIRNAIDAFVQEHSGHFRLNEQLNPDECVAHGLALSCDRPARTYPALHITPYTDDKIEFYPEEIALEEEQDPQILKDLAVFAYNEREKQNLTDIESEFRRKYEQYTTPAYVLGE